MTTLLLADLLVMIHCSGDLIRPTAGIDCSVNFRDKGESGGGVTLAVYRNSDTRRKLNLHPNTNTVWDVCCLK
jgi:hypothetical protein